MTKPRITDAGRRKADRRTGPKCRRVEWDDYQSPYVPEGYKRSLTIIGRRSTDVPFATLPRKSSRLAREKAAEPEEIPVSEGMADEGGTALSEYTCKIDEKNIPKGFEENEIAKAVYRAMERVRREEQDERDAKICRDRAGEPTMSHEEVVRKVGADARTA